jgi:hypothetical protein
VGFRVPLKNGITDIVVAPTEKNWAWRVDILIPGAPRTTTHVAVPNVEEIDFTDLVVVDPSTLQPKAKPDPIWYSWVDGLALTTANAEQAAQDAKLSAEGSQTSALNSANIATDKATVATEKAAEATDKAAQAGTSAFNSAASAASALGHKNDAEAAETGALAAESNAKLYRDGANIARTASEAARDGSVVAKDAAIQARLGAEQAHTEAVALNDITITTGDVDSLGNLILTRTDGTTKDAGRVILPTELTIGEVETGPMVPGIVGPQGPQGPKGDPGGWTIGPVISAGTSLDTITSPGLYLNASANSGAAPSNNTGYGGHLEVIANANWIIQRYTNIFEVRETYIRYRNSSGTWGPWYAQTTARVDQTAGRAIYQWDDINNRDQIIYGDTGWRDVRSLVNTANFDTTTRVMNLRREGSTVRLSGQLQVLAGVTAFSYSTFLAIPIGFRVPSGIPFMVGTETTALQIRTITALLRLLTSGNDVAIQTINGTGTLGNMAAGDVINISTSWSTSDAWPNTLPGTAVGSIPNV